MQVPRISPEDKSCVTCRYFDFNPKRDHALNRECLFEGKLHTYGGKCVAWKDSRTLKERILGKKVRVKAFTA